MLFDLCTWLMLLVLFLLHFVTAREGRLALLALAGVLLAAAFLAIARVHI